MRPLRLEEIADLESYPRLRDGYRRALIAHKQTRRMAVGESVTLLFEDRETLRFQVQEMLHVERIAEPARVQHELDVYNELMPGERELSATLFVEIAEQAKIRSELDRLIGIDEHVALRLGEGAAAHDFRARFDPKQMEEERISAVQYIRFALDAAGVAHFSDLAAPAAIAIDHPNYRRVAPIPDPVRRSLVAGLHADPQPLLAPEPARERRADITLFEVGALRATARGGDPLDVWITPRDARPAAAWLAGEARFGADLEEALRRAAAEVGARAGGARIEALLREDGAPLGWRVTAIRR